jgi:hypothetical protein
VPQKRYDNQFVPGTKFLVLDVLSREQKFNQGHLLAMIAPELSKENTNGKQRVAMTN